MFLLFCSFVVTNGDTSLNGSLLFIIQHGDRVPPTLTRNAGLQLQAGSTAPITPAALQLTDPDTAASDLSFVVTRPPRHGQLLLGGVQLATPGSFLQSDVDRLSLAYRHAPGSPGGGDAFHFLPSDGINRGYLEFSQLRAEPAVFNIQVSRRGVVPPPPAAELTCRSTPSPPS